MSWPYDSDTLTAIERLEDVNGNDYDASLNPDGLGRGGHRVNFAPDLNAIAEVANSIADAAEAAEAAAEALTGTSTSSVSIGTGTKTFTTQAGKQFGEGVFVLIVSATGDGDNYMIGQVASYSSTTLQVDVETIGGSGTLNDWTIYVSGKPGAAGATGATGATGGTGATGDPGRAAGLLYSFSTTTTTADPTAGKLRYNNATPASVTELYISEADNDGNNVAALLATLDDSTSTVKGRIEVRNPLDPSQGSVFSITGAITDNGAWITAPVSHLSGTGLPSNNADVMVTFSTKGDKGDTGSNGSAGATGDTGPAVGVVYDFSTTTSDSDPGSGNLRFNNATPASVTSIFVDNVDAGGNTQTTWLDGFDDSTHSALRGTLYIVPVDDPDHPLVFNVTGAVTDGTGYRKIAVAHVSGATLPADAAALAITFARTGDDGADGEGSGNVNYESTTPTEGNFVVAGGSTNEIKDGGAFTAETVPFVPAGGVAASNVQDAIEEVDTEKAPKASPAFTGTIDIQQAQVLTGDISPSQITSNQNDYAPSGFSTASVIRLDADAARNITGLAGGAEGRRVLLFNVGSFPITLKNETTSTEANRFALYADLILQPKMGAWVFYDNTSSRWRAEKSNGAPEIAFTPTGNLAATDVAGALAELDTEKIPTSYLDTDGTLAGNSDSKLATQKATKTYADTKLAKSSNLSDLTNAGTARTNLGLAAVAASGSAADLSTGTLPDARLSSAATPYGKQGVFIPAAGMTARTTNGAGSGSVEATTNKNMFVTKDFDASTQEYAQFFWRMPASWNESTVTFAPVWSHPSTSTNFGVVFTLAGVAISNDDTGDVAFGTAQSSTDTGGTTDDIYEGPESSAITIAGTPQAGDFVMFQISRLVSDGSDTMAVDARLHGIMLFITTDAGHD